MNHLIVKKIIKTVRVITLLFFLSTFALAQGDCKLSGRVVDENKKPVPNARVYLDPLKKDEDGLGVYAGAESDANGEFTIEFDTCSMTHTRELFAIAATDWNAVGKFFAPDELSFLLPLKGQKIQVVKNGHTQVGDIQRQVLLKTIEIKLVDEKGENFYKSKDDWAKLKYQLYGKLIKPIVQFRGKPKGLVSEGGISWVNVKTAVSQDNSTIKWILPDGRWRMVLFPKGCRGAFQASSDYFEISKEKQPLIQLTVKKTRAGNKCLILGNV